MGVRFTNEAPILGGGGEATQRIATPRTRVRFPPTYPDYLGMAINGDRAELLTPYKAGSIPAPRANLLLS